MSEHPAGDMTSSTNLTITTNVSTTEEVSSATTTTMMMVMTSTAESIATTTPTISAASPMNTDHNNPTTNVVTTEDTKGNNDHLYTNSLTGTVQALKTNDGKGTVEQEQQQQQQQDTELLMNGENVSTTAAAVDTDSSDMMVPMHKKQEEQKNDLAITTVTTENEGIQQQQVGTATVHSDRPWDHSNRKVLVQGIDKFHDVRSATKVVHQWLDRIQSKQQQQQLPSTTTSSSSSNTNNTIITSKFVIDKIKKPPNSNWCIITLQEESMVEPFIQSINTSNLRSRKGNNIFAKIVQGNTNNNNNSNTGNNTNRKHRNDDDTEEQPNDKKYESNKRRRMDDDNNSNDNTDINAISSETSRRPITIEEIKDKIIPLWKLSTQEEQLQYKMKEMIKKCAMKIIIDIKSKFRALEKEKARSKMNVYPWILQQRCIDVQPIVTAPTPLRNKCELTFGYQYDTPPTTDNIAGTDCDMTSDVKQDDNKTVVPENEIVKVPAVGFMVTGWSGGVAFAKELPNIPHEVSVIVEILNSYLLSSPFVPYDVTTHTGFWRILTIRTSRRTKECMIIIQHNSPERQQQQSFAEAVSKDPSNPVAVDWKAIFEEEKAKIITMLTENEIPTEPNHPSIRVTSIFFQEFSGLSNPLPEHPVQHAYGKTFLTEQLSDCMFQISPGAFFQVNTEGAEILYQLVVEKVREITSPNFEQSLLFDVCCGTGTIGLTCMKAGVVGQVVGVDISEPAIADARRNALLNGYTTNESNDVKDGRNDTTKLKTRFVASRAELVLGREIQNAKQRHHHIDSTDERKTPSDLKFIAVVDPAREGLHADVIKAIRSNQRITRLVYVSCNPTATLVRDAALFCSPPTKRYTGRPFRISSAQPVDMFPLTNHCEMVMTFDRLTDEEML